MKPKPAAEARHCANPNFIGYAELSGARNKVMIYDATVKTVDFTDININQKYRIYNLSRRLHRKGVYIRPSLILRLPE
jgi:hypothetical protein